MPLLISRSGAGAWATAPSQARQAYFGRCVTITRNWAGILSRRCELSSPMTCIAPWQHGQTVLSGSSVTWMCGERSAVGPSRPLRVRRLVRRLLLLPGRILFGNRGLDILQRELHRVAIEPLRPRPELCTLQLLQEMTKLVVLFRQPAALLDQCIALTREPAHQGPQTIEIIRKRIDRHERSQADSRSCGAHNMQPDSISRRPYDVAVGRTTSRACRRDQSIPSTSAAS